MLRRVRQSLMVAASTGIPRYALVRAGLTAKHPASTRPGIPIDESARRGVPCGEFGDQVQRRVQSALEHQVGIGAPLEPIGCRRPPALHAQVDLLHGLPDQDRVEVSRFDQDLGGRLRRSRQNVLP